MHKNILIADKDKRFVDSLKYIFNKEEYTIDCIDTASELLKKIKDNECDLVILEKEIDNVDGIELCKAIRNISTVPIIILSKCNKEMSKILALEHGADDYLVKPISMSELKARIKTIFRRMEYKINMTPRHIIEINNFTINLLKKIISIRNKDINFTGKEFDIFYILFSNPGKLFTREELLDEVWGYEHYGDIRTVDVHVRRIREKIEKATDNTKYIMTKWGKGYYFNHINLISSSHFISKGR